jgi:serine/threonine-protein kinase
MSIRFAYLEVEMKVCPKCQKQFSDDANFCPVDAARLVPAEAQTSAADPLTARFTLGDRLGGSRTGSVYRATDRNATTTNQQVAVKLVAPAVTALPGVAQRLERELKQIERVQSTGVAKVIASGKRTAGGAEETWLAIELLDGAQTLAEAIAARGPIPLEQAAHLIEVIGEALIEAAQVGVVHRDLAPKNVLFTGDQIKLINFSLPVPTSDRVPGVPEFVAPEQVDGKPVDQRSNLYSLGALYYYVLTGQTPHSGSSPDEIHRAHVNATIKTPSSLAPVPANVEAVIMRALDRSPTKRFLTVRQFVDEVGRIARGDKSDPKATMPMGKIGGKPKAELVQTLLGVRSGGAAFGTPAITAPAAAPPAGGMHPTPGHLSAPPMAQPVAVATNLPPPQAASGAATVMGVPSGVVGATESKSAPVAAAPQPAPQPAQDGRSPWAPPASAAPAAAASAPPEMPAPAPAPSSPTAATVGPTPAAAAKPPATIVPAAPVVPQAPVVAPPKVANAPTKSGKEETKGKFRETMWFKKGDLDAQAAVAAAEERARTGKEVAADKADTLPIDERYKDDGSISRGDKEKYSLRTGATQMMKAIKDKDAGASTSRVSEDALIGEMKQGRSLVLLFIVLGVAAIGALIFMLAR